MLFHIEIGQTEKSTVSAKVDGHYLDVSKAVCHLNTSDSFTLCSFDLNEGTIVVIKSMGESRKNKCELIIQTAQKESKREINLTSGAKTRKIIGQFVILNREQEKKYANHAAPQDPQNVFQEKQNVFQEQKYVHLNPEVLAV